MRLQNAKSPGWARILFLSRLSVCLFVCDHDSKKTQNWNYSKVGTIVLVNSRKNCIDCGHNWVRGTLAGGNKNFEVAD